MSVLQFPSTEVKDSILSYVSLSWIRRYWEYYERKERKLLTENYKEYVLGSIKSISKSLNGELNNLDQDIRKYKDQVIDDLIHDLIVELKDNVKEIEEKITKTAIIEIIEKSNNRLGKRFNSFGDDDELNDDNWAETNELMGLDLKYFDEYFNMVSELKVRFLDICNKHILIYEKGNIKHRFSVQRAKGDFKVKDGLEKVILADYIFQFGKIEEELTKEGYLNDNYEWIGKKKKVFCEFLITILGYGYTNKKVLDINVRQFFEKRYGKPKGYLSEMFRPVKRKQIKLKDAQFTFGFISPPQEKM